MNRINVNEMILLLNPNSQGVTQEKPGSQLIIKLRNFYPKIIGSFLPRNPMMVYLLHVSYFENFKNIVAIGGDGTFINEIANGFFCLKSQNKHIKDFEKFNLNSRLKPVNPKGIMYVIPSGSRNVLARSLALKHQGVGGLMRIKHMKRRKMDVISSCYNRQRYSVFNS